MNPLEPLHLLSCPCNRGWICDVHPASRFLHERCPGPGAPCRNPRCPYWQGPQPLAREPRVQFADMFILRDMMRARFLQH
jgi:hypothetical protein